ncbi:UDP-glycosyltransferase TURAN-like isoform X1 [Coffea arabica]|uniref:UDP-glycosyltransferase TURAN-like isoform X1 n=1 Tax=Coffea arabica TaxID=13443 RepID=A0ABM4UCY1_COFAR
MNWIRTRGLSKKQLCFMINLLNFSDLLPLRRSMRISESLSQPFGLQDCISYGMTGTGESDPNSTLFTIHTGTNIIMKQNRPAIIVSSTSWTPDENFSILLEAALMYDRRVAGLLNEDDVSDGEILWNEILCQGGGVQENH